MGLETKVCQRLMKFDVEKKIKRQTLPESTLESSEITCPVEIRFVGLCWSPYRGGRCIVSYGRMLKNQLWNTHFEAENPLLMNT